ncbi:MAG: acetylglutamate kinase [Microbacteriaceae bacterium]
MSTTRQHTDAAAKASVLIESLPWLKSFAGKTIVIKFGGNAMVSDELKERFAEDMVYLRTVGVRPVIVHGGGPQITAMLDKLGISSEFRAGYRYTSPEAMEVVREVLTEHISGELVTLINEHGALATGIPGDTGLFIGRRLSNVNGEVVDLGLVGEVTTVDPTSVIAALDAGRIPVVSTIAPDENEPTQSLNVNADSAASALAVALQAEKLMILTDVPGLYANWPDTSSLVSSITTRELRDMLPALESGMIPKATACVDAVEGGVHKAAMIDGRVPHGILLEVFTPEGVGTEVVLTEGD